MYRFCQSPQKKWNMINYEEKCSFIHSFSIGVKCHKFGRKILEIKNNSKRRKKKRDNGSKHGYSLIIGC